MRIVYIITSLLITISCNNSNTSSPSVENTIKNDDSLSFKKEYYEDGSIKAIMAVNEEGILDGEVRQFYPSGKIINKTFFRDGIRIGKNIVYYENTNIKIEENYNSNGRLEGEFKEYFEDGSLKKVGQYNDGNKYGLWKEFRKDGVLYELNNYKSDLLDGEQKVFHPNEQLALVGFAKEGVYVNDWIYLDLNGDTLKIETYKLGEVINTKVYKESVKANYD